jgi:hypothetical protein
LADVARRRVERYRWVASAQGLPMPQGSGEEPFKENTMAKNDEMLTGGKIAQALNATPADVKKAISDLKLAPDTVNVDYMTKVIRAVVDMTRTLVSGEAAPVKTGSSGGQAG